MTAFHQCSEVLKPFLLKYLGQASVSAGPQYQGTQTHTPTHSEPWQIQQLCLMLPKQA